MKPDGNIIAIRNRSIDDANAAFADFMRKTEDCFNQRSKQDPNLYKNVKPTELEQITERVLKEIAPSTPFNPNEIKLISGHKFPDIVAEKYYGVEVKSTKENKWTSTGSSIVESTRIDDVDNIYMLFGKLGGTPAEFKCRPYQDVLYDIAVTHSPRYLIDMTLNQGETIFDKLHVSYDTLRNSQDNIERVKDYYKKQAKEQGGQMPWWIDDTNTDPISMNICLWNSLPSNYRDELRAQLLILFPETVSSDYGNAALWLASAKGIVNPSMRDLFTAGGRVRSIAGSSFQEGLPKIWLTLSRYYDIIITYLIPNSPILPYIKEYNPELVKSTNMYNQWLKQIDKRLGSVVIDHVEYSIKEVLENKMLNCVSDD